MLYKIDNAGQFILLPSSIWTRIDARTIEITVTDGDALTDGDGVANGLIADPIAPAAISRSSTSVSTSTGGSGGGCTLSISSVHQDPTFLLLILVSLGSLLCRQSDVLRYNSVDDASDNCTPALRGKDLQNDAGESCNSKD